MQPPAPLKWARLKMNSVTGKRDLPEGQECYYCEAGLSIFLVGFVGFFIGNQLVLA